VFRYDVVSSAWIPNQVRLKTWNAAGLETSNTQVNFVPSLGTWLPSMRNDYEYDANGNLVLSKDLRWNNTSMAWDTFSVVRFVRTFDASDSLLTYLAEERLSPSLVYVPFTSITITRDAAGRKIEQIDALESPHRPLNKLIWVYPASGGYVTYEHHRMIGGVWSAYFKHTDIVWHDFALDQRESYVQKYLDGSGGLDHTQHLFTWMPFNSYSETRLDLSMSPADTVDRNSTYYNSLGLVSVNYHESHVSAWDTTDLDSTSYLHNGSGCMTQSIYHGTRWFGPGTFGPYIKHDYVYAPVGIADAAEKPVFTLAPNPANEKITPRWQGGPEEIEVLDLAGRILIRLPQWESGNPISLTSLTQGIYWMRSQGVAIPFVKVD
jgi:hypothetical protein